MKNNTVITISRQYGSGGRLIGKMLAEKLGIPYYDKELINIAAKDSGFAEDLFHNVDQNATNSLLYSLSIYGNTVGLYDMPLNDKLFIAQSKAIKKVAAQGPCVIVGRCADYVLRDFPNVLNVFIHSDMESKLHRVTEDYKPETNNIVDYINKTDKRRATYYNYYTGMKWGRADNYHLSIRSDSVGLEGAVDTIISFVEAKNRQIEAEAAE